MRTFILLNHRAGSTFLTSLLNGKIIRNKYGIAGTDMPEDMRVPNWLWTTPKALHYNPSCGHGTLLQDYIMKTDVVTHPEVYSIYAGIDWTDKFFKRLPGPEDEWKFIYLLRDPRNRTASMISWGNQKSDEQKLKEGINNFKKQAKSLKSMMKDPRFRVFTFEDLVSNPLEEFDKIMSFAGLQIEKDMYKDLIDSWYNVSNSSFSDKGQQANIRWHNWPDTWKRQFLEETHQELVDLGYNLEEDVL